MERCDKTPGPLTRAGGESVRAKVSHNHASGEEQSGSGLRRGALSRVAAGQSIQKWPHSPAINGEKRSSSSRRLTLACQRWKALVFLAERIDPRVPQKSLLSTFEPYCCNDTSVNTKKHKQLLPGKIQSLPRDERHFTDARLSFICVSFPLCVGQRPWQPRRIENESQRAVRER